MPRIKVPLGDTPVNPPQGDRTPTTGEFLNQLGHPFKEAEGPPPVGIKITCHLVLRHPEAFPEVTQVLEACREYGSAEVIEYVLLRKD